MYKKWKDYELPTCSVVNEREYHFNSDFRCILDSFVPLNDKDLLEPEKIECAFYIFYGLRFSEVEKEDLKDLIECMMLFFGGNRLNKKKASSKPLLDWEQDLPIILAPIKRIAGKDIRSEKYYHWWTFLADFMEIGECTFSTYVGIRDKLNKGGRNKLAKHEQKIYKENRDKIDIKKKYDSATQAELNRILGK